MTANTFRLQNVSKAYGQQHALSDVTLDLPPGEHTAIVGPSGCGKSTLLRLLAGLDVPTSGEIFMNGKPASEAGHIFIPPHQRDLAMVFQDLALWPNLSVVENAMLGLSRSVSKQEARTRADEALTLCSIPELADRKPGELSGGQQQRVALARAIATRPSFLLLDEPFASLDLSTKSRLLSEIARLADIQQVTLLLVTHDPMEAAALCARAVLIDAGRITEVGVLGDMFRQSSVGWLKHFRQQIHKMNDAGMLDLSVGQQGEQA